MTEKFPDEWGPIIVYLKKYPRFYFRSSTLSKRLSTEGTYISSCRLSKILLEMYNNGILERRTRGKRSQHSFYKWHKDSN